MTEAKWVFRSIQMMLLFGFGIACMAVLGLVVVPHGWETWQIQQQLGDARFEINTLAKKLDSLQDLQQEDLQANVSVLLRVLPDKFDVAQVVSTIKQLALEHQVEVSEVAAVVEEKDEVRGPVDQKTAEGLETQRLKVTVRASIGNLIKFLENIDQVTPLVQVAKLDSQVNQDASLFDAELQIESFALQIDAKNTELSKQEALTISAEDQRLLESLRQWKSYPLIPASSSGELQRGNPFEL